jgi:hypothetical protein
MVGARLGAAWAFLSSVLASVSLTRLLAGVPFAALAAAGYFVGLLCTWELVAVWTGRLPSISAVTASHWAGLPLGWKALALFGAGCGLGALLVHFTGWKPLPGTET